MKNGEKRYIPGTNPDWGRELPDGYDNSLVDAGGHPCDYGWNFDERDDEPEDNSEKQEGNAA